MLRQIVAAYELKGEDRFKIRAYQNAAASVEHATEEAQDLWEEGKLRDLAGIGSAIESHLNELFQKGQVRHFEEVKKSLPAAMFQLLDVPGIGAKTAFALAKSLKLREKSAIPDLLAALQAGKVRSLPGFGETSEKSILENLEKKRKTDDRLPLPAASDLANKILSYLRQNHHVKRAEALGSLRRRVATVGDIDIAVATDQPQKVVEYFARYPEVAEVLNEGGIKGRIILKNGRQIDLMTQKPAAFGALLQHFTGSKGHNIRLRELAKSQGLSLSEYGIKGGNNQIREFDSEERFYSALGLAYIEPELREDRGELEAAQKHQLPELVTVTDLKGDLQMHTTWSDGRNTVEEMIKTGIAKGYQYLGLTDHQLSLEKRSYENVIREIKRRKSLIDQISYSNKNIRVLNGVEVLIKANGDLAYPNEVLAEFDYALAAIHTGFSQDKKLITQRIIQALRNPYINILAHPTGRLVGRRESLDADWDEVFKVCLAEGKVLEIDGFPDRLDLPDILVRAAKGYGIKFSVDSDAHAVEHLDLIGYGIDVARRGWLESEDVINTYSWERLKKTLSLRIHD